MNIVIVDFIGMPDNALARLKKLGTVTHHNDLPANDEVLLKRLAGQDVAIGGWCHFPTRVLEQCPGLKMISLYSAGDDYVDVPAARRLGIHVTTTSGYADVVVAEFVLGQMLALLHRIWEAGVGMHKGIHDWHRWPGQDLHGKTVGIVGCGNIARRVMHLLHAFGANILCYTRTPDESFGKRYGVCFLDLDALLAQSDIVSLHLPLTNETHGMFDAEKLGKMKKGALLINSARGALTEEEAIMSLLKSGHLGGAAIDAFASEPFQPPASWLALPNLLLTPHIAFYSQQAIIRKADLCVGNIEKFLSRNAR